MKKTFILISIAIITIVAVCFLVKYMKMDRFMFAWALNFLLMLCTLTFTQALNSQFTSSYYDEKKWEQRGKIYEQLGINFFRKLLVWTGWEKLNKKSNPIAKTPEALINLHYQTKKNELGHVMIFFIVLGFNVFVAFKFGILKSLWLLILNVLLNLYPIFLQRYNRPRIERVINLSRRRPVSIP
ncbi:hypothetical protein [Chitinophaga sp.]|uniref:glycosyl-4,4'-diaponeurosporenoate acyltransferase CrtO family protein n=1 Tax=Chitinophaga sp. TaxID=1869181 RepID=UPI002F93AFAF